jgi:hypothetical protein
MSEKKKISEKKRVKEECRSYFCSPQKYECQSLIAPFDILGVALKRVPLFNTLSTYYLGEILFRGTSKLTLSLHFITGAATARCGGAKLLHTRNGRCSTIVRIKIDLTK